MDLDYQLTHQLLNTIFEFSKLHGLLYSQDMQNRWMKELKDFEEKEAALAAVIIDSDLDISAVKTDELVVPKDVEKKYLQYKKVKSKLADVFADISTFKVVNINTLHSRILGQSGETILPYRQINKSINRLVNDNGIYKKITVKTKTDPKEIPSKMRSLAKFLQNEFKTINPIMLAGISHYKIVAIHPFDDANGRLARLMTHGILFMHGIDIANLLPIEEYYLLKRDRYYELLEKTIQTEDLTEWLEFYAQALLYAVKESIRKLKVISSGVMDLESNNKVEITPKEEDILNRLKQDKSSGADLARELGISRQSVNNTLQKLHKKGLLIKTGQGSGTRYKVEI
jgi:biotin operon repressor/prophage maintenance system killer protein